MGALGGGVFAGAGHALGRVTGVVKNGCFEAGTQVLMADGSHKSIEDIAAGDLVAAFNPVSGEVEPGMVSDTFVHEQVATWELTTETGSVITTAVHPFYVEGKGWVEAQDLRTGDQLRDDTGGLVAVVSIAATGDVATVYNFTVEQHHNYHVQTGTSWVLVHNALFGLKCGVEVDIPAGASPRETVESVARGVASQGKGPLWDSIDEAKKARPFPCAIGHEVHDQTAKELQHLYRTTGSPQFNFDYKPSWGVDYTHKPTRTPVELTTTNPVTIQAHIDKGAPYPQSPSGYATYPFPR